MINFFEHIYAIDECLKDFGLDTNYEKFRKILKRQIIFAFFAFYFISMANCALINDIHATVFNYWGQLMCYHFICIVPMMINTFKIFQYINCLVLINGKYESINKMLQNSLESPNLMRTLRRVACLQHKLHETKNLLEDSFGLFNVVSLGCQFSVITIQTFNIFIHFSGQMYFHPYELSLMILWIFVQIFYVYMYVITCSTTSRNVTVEILFGLLISQKILPFQANLAPKVLSASYGNNRYMDYHDVTLLVLFSFQNSLSDIPIFSGSQFLHTEHESGN